MTLSKVTIAPISPSDYVEIATLQSDAFAHEEFGRVAFGAERVTETAWAVKSLGKGPGPGETLHKMKAVVTLPDGAEEIVGFASWITCVGRGGSEEERKRLGTKEAWAEEEKGRDKKGKEEEFGNAKLRHDVLEVGDEFLAKATGGFDYASKLWLLYRLYVHANKMLELAVLVVSPKYQRQGIGAMLLEDGLKRADEASLQTVLGASPFGLGLYQKYGFVGFETRDINLWEYEGGKGCGVNRTVMMHRPAGARKS
jgi:GNAT superfamily N-acetyltransferase